jgi:hypothetical protein
MKPFRNFRFGLQKYSPAALAPHSCRARGDEGAQLRALAISRDHFIPQWFGRYFSPDRNAFTAFPTDSYSVKLIVFQFSLT